MPYPNKSRCKAVVNDMGLGLITGLGAVNGDDDIQNDNIAKKNVASPQSTLTERERPGMPSQTAVGQIATATLRPHRDTAW